jgi:ATP-dependent Clp protease ATP-binding subunit ClpA
MGARPLQRVIDKEIKMPLARELLFGKLKAGGNLTIDVVDNAIALKVINSETVTQE